jgi:hypothetical protein
MSEATPEPATTAAQRRIVIRPGLFTGVRLLVARNESDPTEEVNRAVREYLERNQLWPLPQTGGDLDTDPPAT